MRLVVAPLAIGVSGVAAAPAGAVVSSVPDSTLQTNSTAISAIVRSADRVFIAGNFTRIGTPTGPGADLAQSDATPNFAFAKPNGNVDAVVSDGQGGWYVGGDFTALGGVTRNRLGHLLAGGSLDPSFDPNMSSTVNALALSGGKLYAGGTFTTVNGGTSRNRLAAFDATTGIVDAGFNPSVSGTVSALALSGGEVYAGGAFGFVNCPATGTCDGTVAGTVTRNRIAAFDATTGNVDAGFNPSIVGLVNSLAVVGSTVYVGGQFTFVNCPASGTCNQTTAGAVNRNRVAAFDLAGNVLPFNPSTDNTVNAIAVSGSTVYLGGTFRAAGCPTTTTTTAPDTCLATGFAPNAVVRNRLAAFDATSGSLLSFDPEIDPTITSNNPIVSALALSGTNLYAAGSFASVGATSRNRIAAFDTATGTLSTSFDPNVDNAVFALAAAGSRIYAGGSFSFVGANTVRNRVAALKLDGTLDPTFDPNVNNLVSVLALSGSTLYAGGSFTLVNGTVARNRLAAFDTTTGAATAFDANVNIPVTALAASGGSVYAGGNFTTVNGSVARNRIAKFDPTTGAVDPAFDANINSAVNAIAPFGGKLYVGGGFSTVNGTVSRLGLAAVDPSTGIVDPTFNPNAFSVLAMVMANGKVYAGGTFTTVNGSVTRNRLAAFDPTTGVVDPTFDPNLSGQVSALAISGSTLYAGGQFTTVNGGVARNRLAAVDSTTGTVDATFNPNMGNNVNALAASGPKLYAGGSFTTVGGAPQSGFAQFSEPAPAAPTFTVTVPASPSNNNSPVVQGTAVAGSTVTLYTDPNCTGAVAATGTAADFASSGLAVNVPSDASTTFYATATVPIANTSICSSSSITYVEDSTAPAPPVVTGTTPASPANNNSPAVKGTAESGSTVNVYSDAACTSPVAATGSAADFAASGVTGATVADNSTTTFYATATDAAGNVSACSSTFTTYVEDSTVPASPTFAAVVPASPSSNNSPVLTGAAPAGSTVKLYTDAACTSTVSASGTAAAFASPGLTVTVASDSSTTFYATATNAAGTPSDCSSSSITYVEDSTAPALPTLTATVPDSPANDNAPKVKGGAEAGSTVKLYTNAACTSAVAATGTAGDFASPGLTVSVTDNSSTTFYATATDAAGNTSGCSTSSITYAEDSTAPALPALTATDPASPANNNAPKVQGAAEAGSTVKLYTNATCTSAVAATGTAAAFASPGLSATVAGDASTTFHATATDKAGNTSGCSTSSIAYVEDSTAPALPALTATDPASPANDNAPKVKGTAEAGSTVKLYTNATCTSAVGATGTAAAFASPGLPVAVADNTTTTFYATATDAAGNTSACSTSSVVYVENSAVVVTPPPPTIVPPPPPPPPNPPVKDTTAPTAKLGGATIQKLGATVRITVSCVSEACTATGSGTVRVPKLGVVKAKTYKLAKVVKAVGKGKTVTLTLKVSATTRNAIRRALRAKRAITAVLTVSVADAAGNSRTLTRKMRLKL